MYTQELHESIEFLRTNILHVLKVSDDVQEQANQAGEVNLYADLNAIGVLLDAAQKVAERDMEQFDNAALEQNLDNARQELDDRTATPLENEDDDLLDPGRFQRDQGNY